MHTDYSNDSNALMEDMIKKSIDLGIDEIAITDHNDFDINCELIPGKISLEKYFKLFTSLKEKYNSKINILLGVEVGLSPNLSSPVDKLLSSYDFDFVIGSTHDSYGIDLYDGSFFKGKEKNEAFYEYFHEVLTNIKLFDGFSVYGHLDYIRRYGGYADNSLYYEEYNDVIDKIILELISRGKGLEVNASGFRYGLNQVHPQLSILKRYKELGGEILTVGSDAHSPKHIYENMDEAYEVIKEAGFKRLTRFKNRKPYFINI